MAGVRPTMGSRTWNQQLRAAVQGQRLLGGSRGPEQLSGADAGCEERQTSVRAAWTCRRPQQDPSGCRESYLYFLTHVGGVKPKTKHHVD